MVAQFAAKEAEQRLQLDYKSWLEPPSELQLPPKDPPDFNIELTAFDAPISALCVLC